MSKQDELCVYVFENIEVDLQAERMMRAGAEVHLAPKVLKILHLLVRSPNTLLTRQEIFEKVWPRQDVSDASLSQAILTLRRALGGSEELLKTVPRRGYILCAEVRCKERANKAVAWSEHNSPTDQSIGNSLFESDALAQKAIDPSAATKLARLSGSEPHAENASIQIPRDAPRGGSAHPMGAAISQFETTPAHGIEPAVNQTAPIWPKVPQGKSWSIRALAIASIFLCAALLAVGWQKPPDFAAHSLRVDVESQDEHLARAIRALIAQRVMHRLKVLLDNEADPVDPAKLLRLAIRIDVSSDTNQTLKWQWSLLYQGKLKSGAATSPTSELNDAIAQALSSHLPMDAQATPANLPSRALTLYGQALSAEQAGDWQRARDILQQALDIAPGQVQLQLDLARMLSKAGMVRAADAYYRQIQQSPNVDANTLIYARAKIANQENPKLAVELWQQLPETEETLSEQFSALLGLGKVLELRPVLARLERLLEGGALHPKVIYLLACIEEFDRPDVAKSLFLKALGNERLSSELRGVIQSRLADAAYREGDIVQARLLLNLAVPSLKNSLKHQFDAKQFLHFLNKGFANCTIDHELIALDAMAKKLGSDYAIFAAKFAYAQFDDRCYRTEQAISHYSIAAKFAKSRNPGLYQIALYNRALLYGYQGNVRQALADLRAIESSNPRSISEDNLDSLKLRLGQPAKSPVSRACFNAVRERESEQRRQYAKQCLARKNEVYARGTFLHTLLLLVADENNLEVTGQLQQLAKSASPSEIQESTALCAVQRSTCTFLKEAALTQIPFK